MKTVALLLMGLSLAGSAGALAAPHAEEARPRTGAVKAVSMTAPEGEDRVLITVSVVSYPGVPERASCRLLFRAQNQSRDRVGLSTVLHTYDSYKADLNAWLIPTGDLAPGQTVERLYSCKSAVYMRVSQSADSGWPRSCTVNGEKTSPCPVAINLASNLQFLPLDGTKLD